MNFELKIAAFMLLAIVGIALSTIAFATPHWNEKIKLGATNVTDDATKSTSSSSDQENRTEEASYGLISAYCSQNGSWAACKNYFSVS